MLPKKERFSSKDFSNKSLFKSNKKIYTRYGFFVVLDVYTPGGLQKKGVVLSKKNFKTAVVRNKYKRLFYNTVLELQKENQKLTGISLVFYPSKTFTKNELELDLLKIVI